MTTAISDVDAVASDAAYYLIEPLTRLLKELAQSASWPAEIVEALYIDFDGERLTVAYPPSMTDEIMDLEYGRGTERPNSVIRSFSYRAESILKNVIASRTVDALFELEEVF